MLNGDDCLEHILSISLATGLCEVLLCWSVSGWSERQGRGKVCEKMLSSLSCERWNTRWLDGRLVSRKGGQYKGAQGCGWFVSYLVRRSAGRNSRGERERMRLSTMAGTECLVQVRNHPCKNEGIQFLSVAKNQTGRIW